MMPGGQQCIYSGSHMKHTLVTLLGSLLAIVHTVLHAFPPVLLPPSHYQRIVAPSGTSALTEPLSVTSGSFWNVALPSITISSGANPRQRSDFKVLG